MKGRLAVDFSFFLRIIWIFHPFAVSVLEFGPGFKVASSSVVPQERESPVDGFFDGSVHNLFNGRSQFVVLFHILLFYRLVPEGFVKFKAVDNDLLVLADKFYDFPSVNSFIKS